MGSSPRLSKSRFTVPVLAIVAAMTVTVAVGGCTGSRLPRPAAAGPSTTVAAAAAQAAARSVIAQDATTLQWSWLVGHAELQLVAQCMKGHGYTYAVPDAGPEPTLAAITADAIGRRGPATYGIVAYGAEPTDTEAKLASFQQALVGGVTEAASLTLPDGSTVGYQTGGCLGEARARLFGSVRAYVTSAYLPQVVRDEFEAFLAKDGAYSGALGVWRACMTGRHWPFAAPAAAISSLEGAPADAASLSRRQTAIAGADHDCDSKSHLRADRSQALTRFSAGLSGQLLAELDQVSADRVLAGRVAHATAAPDRQTEKGDRYRYPTIRGTTRPTTVNDERSVESQ
jgi:hypothetical protein